MHCVAGVSRSASIVCAYLMASKGMSLEQARQLCKKQRPCTRPNETFLKELKDFAAGLQQSKVGSQALMAHGMHQIASGVAKVDDFKVVHERQPTAVGLQHAMRALSPQKMAMGAMAIPMTSPLSMGLHPGMSHPGVGLGVQPVMPMGPPSPQKQAMMPFF